MAHGEEVPGRGRGWDAAGGAAAGRGAAPQGGRGRAADRRLARPATTTATSTPARGPAQPSAGAAAADSAAGLSMLLDHQGKLGVGVARRDPAVYDAAAGLGRTP